MDRIRLAILASGRGSNAETIVKACRSATYPAKVDSIISDNPIAGAFDVAKKYGIESHGITPVSREYFARFLRWFITGVDLVVLAGFMRILDADFVREWEGRIVNIHPSLLPAFPGLHPQRRAIEAGIKMTGCTVHWVVPEVDAGPMIAQMEVPIFPGDTEDVLSARILEREHALYPLAIKMIAPEILQRR
jgi:phosphoribosylglycinamide formyltransferase 1